MCGAVQTHCLLLAYRDDWDEMLILGVDPEGVVEPLLAVLHELVVAEPDVVSVDLLASQESKDQQKIVVLLSI